MKTTQIKFVQDKLNKDGCITRNFALENYISRLSSIIQRFKNEGYKFRAERIDLQNGRYDFKYTLLD